MIPFLLPSIVQQHIKTARNGDQNLLQCLVSVPGAGRPTRDIVQVVDPLDLKGNMLFTFYKGQVSTRIVDYGKVNLTAINKRHGMFFLPLWGYPFVTGALP